jgi:hypothetical protein
VGRSVQVGSGRVGSVLSPNREPTGAPTPHRRRRPPAGHRRSPSTDVPTADPTASPRVTARRSRRTARVTHPDTVPDAARESSGGTECPATAGVSGTRGPGTCRPGRSVRGRVSAATTGPPGAPGSHPVSSLDRDFFPPRSRVVRPTTGRTAPVRSPGDRAGASRWLPAGENRRRVLEIPQRR